MRLSWIRSLFLLLSCLVLAQWTLVDAATCPKICNQKTIWGIGPQSTGYASCECTTIIAGAGSGPNQCVCGICYLQAGGRISGYAKETNGQCPSGATDCGDCDIASGSGSGAHDNSTKTTAPPSTNPPTSNSPTSLTPSTPSPSATSSSTAGNITALVTLPPGTTTPSPTPTNRSEKTDAPSSAHETIDVDRKPGTSPTDVATTPTPSSSTKSSSNDGLATWQIALIICSCVLVMGVVMMSITSCYCKAKNRMKDNIQNEEEQHEYEGYWNPNNSGGMTTSGHEQIGQATFNGAMTAGGRNSFNSAHSRPNSGKNMPYSEPTYAVDERIGAGMGRPPARNSLGSNGDLPGVYQPFRDGRPSHEVGSRKNIAIEL